MTRRLLDRRLVASVFGAVAVAALIGAVVPQHAAALALLAAGTVCALAAGFVLVAAAPVVAAVRPVTDLDRPPRATAPLLEPPALVEARKSLARPARAGALPGEVWERLVVATALAMQRRGIDIDGPATREQARALVPATTWRHLISPPAPGGRSDPVRVAALVHRMLDDLDASPAPDRRTP